MWIGATNFNTGMYFRVPEDFEYASTYKFEREKNGMKVNRVPAICWFTNLEHGRRHTQTPLMSMADNIKYSKHSEIKGKGYLHLLLSAKTSSLACTCMHAHASLEK